MDFFSFKYNGIIKKGSNLIIIYNFFVLILVRDIKGIYNLGRVFNKLYYIVFCSFLYWIGLLICIIYCKLKY